MIANRIENTGRSAILQPSDRGERRRAKWRKIDATRAGDCVTRGEAVFAKSLSRLATIGFRVVTEDDPNGAWIPVAL